MVYSKQVMQDDIICLKGYALVIKEIRSNCVEGYLLQVGLGSYSEAWAKTSPFIIDEDLLWHLGFELDHDKVWVLEVDTFRISYDLNDHNMFFLSSVNKKGFGHFNVLYLHQIMQLFRIFRLDTINFYKVMKTYKPLNPRE